MRRYLITILMVLLLLVEQVQPNCLSYIQALSTSILHYDAPAMPLYTLMYSGITTNNPGQMYECENKTPAKQPYHYFLISFKNSTTNVETFTGLCVPMECKKEEVEAGLHYLSIKYSAVYDYPKQTKTNGLVVACGVIVGLWLAVLLVWSIVLSCREPVENQYIKKNEEVTRPSEEEPINALSQPKPQRKQDYKMFNFYEGYCRIFKRSNHKNIYGPILFLAAFSILWTTEFSYRQTIAANETKSLKWFDSFGGVLFCNFQIAYSVIVFILGVKLSYALFKLGSFHQIGRYFFDQLLIKWAILVLTSMAAYVSLSMTDQPLNQLWKSKYGADCPSVMYQMWFVFRNLQLDCKVCLQWFWILQIDILLTIVSAPLFLIYRTKKWLGRSLFLVGIAISIILRYAILSNEEIVFQPYKLFNMSKQFTVNYQTNSLVRMGPYFLGFLFGLFINQRKEVSASNDRQKQLKFVKAIRKSTNFQVILHLLGLGLMLMGMLLIIPYLSVAAPQDKRASAHSYLSFVPFVFLIGLNMFLLPCFLECDSKFTGLVTKILSANFWTSLERMSIGFLLLGPVVIGFTTYSMQNSIYFDFETVFVYFLGDCVIIYIITLLAISSIDNQLYSISKWMQAKVFGNEAKDSVIVIEE